MHGKIVWKFAILTLKEISENLTLANFKGLLYIQKYGFERDLATTLFEK